MLPSVVGTRGGLTASTEVLLEAERRRRGSADAVPDDRVPLPVVWVVHAVVFGLTASAEPAACGAVR